MWAAEFFRSAAARENADDRRFNAQSRQMKRRELAEWADEADNGIRNSKRKVENGTF